MGEVEARKPPETVSSSPAGRAQRYARGELIREDLTPFPAESLKDEGDGAATVLKYHLPEGPVVFKEWPARQSGRVLRWWGRLLLRREAAHYRLLQGVPGIPRLLGEIEGGGFVLEFIEALPIKRSLPRDQLERGLDSFEAVMDAIHERGFVHLDLHQRLNTLVDADGQTWLIDLGQGADCSRGLVRRALFPFMCRVDRRAVLKFRARYAPQTLPSDDRERLVAAHGQRRNRKGLALLRKAVRRMFVNES